MKLITEYIAPPVATSKWDWMAFIERNGDDSPTGYGATELEAVKVLCELLAAELEKA